MRFARRAFIGPPVHRKLPLVLTLTAWLFATGSQWDLVQTFAWARMFADNVRTMSIETALARTFSPEGRCRMCNAVTSAKQQQENADDTPSGKVTGKTVLVYLPAPAVVFAARNAAGLWGISGRVEH